MKETKSHTISGETSLVGVLGDPISHSLSPVIHNAALLEMGLNWCYLAIPCNKANLELITKALRKINCKGLNITIPHKTQALNICSKVSEIGKVVGAINTLIPDEKDGWKGTNTDIEGFLKPLQKIGNWEGKKAILLGSGGSSRAVIFALDLLNLSEIHILGRNVDSLNKLTHSLGDKLKNLSSDKINIMLPNCKDIKEHIKATDLIINTTPIGMLNKSVKNNSDAAIPFGEEIWSNLTPQTTLYDIIYNPLQTEWLKLGEKYKCNQINGLEMLIEQGAASLRLWSGIEEIPTKTMKKAAMSHFLN